MTERGTRANQSPDVDPNLFARSSAGSDEAATALERELIVAALRASQPATTTTTGGEAAKEAQKRYPDDADDYGHPESLKHLRDAFMAGASFEKETSARSSAVTETDHESHDRRRP